MAYRSETDAMRARIAELETALAESERENARLRGLGDDDRAWARRIFGVPLALSEERVLTGTLDDAAVIRIVESLQSRFSTAGKLRRLRNGRVIWRIGPPHHQRVVEIAMRQDGSQVNIRAIERLGTLIGGLFGGIVGGVGGGVGLGVGIPLGFAVGMPWLAAVLLPAAIGTSWLSVRAGISASAERRIRELRGAVDSVAACITPIEVVPSVRVVDEEYAAEDEDPERRRKGAV